MNHNYNELKNDINDIKYLKNNDLIDIRNEINNNKELINNIKYNNEDINLLKENLEIILIKIKEGVNNKDYIDNLLKNYK